METVSNRASRRDASRNRRLDGLTRTLGGRNRRIRRAASIAVARCETTGVQPMGGSQDAGTAKTTPDVRDFQASSRLRQTGRRREKRRRSGVSISRRSRGGGRGFYLLQRSEPKEVSVWN